MKKALSLFLAIIMAFGIAAVGITEAPHVHAEENETLQWGDFDYTIENEEVCIVKFHDKELRNPHLAIPDTLGGYPVTAIGPRAFEDSAYVKSVVIPESVKVIDEYAFQYCTELSSVEITGDLDILGSGAFAICKKLTSIILPENIGYLGGAIFWNTAYVNSSSNKDSQDAVYCCDYLIAIESFSEKEFLYVKEGTKGIAGFLSVGNYSLKEVYIPESVQYIGSNPFSDCFALEKITVSENNPYLFTDEDNALYANGGKTLVSYPLSHSDICYVVKEGVEEISEETFNYNIIENIYLPKSIKKINNYGIDEYVKIYYEGNASEWEDVEFVIYEDDVPKSERTVFFNSYNTDHHKLIKKTDSKRYCSCGKIANIFIDEDDKILAENGFRYIPDNDNTNGVKVIGYAYNNSTDPVVIPSTLGGKSVTTIGNYAFDGCQATSITIPATVCDIEVEAFAYIGENLENFYVENGNQHYFAPNGILYDSLSRLLVRYPTNASAEKYTLYDSTMGIMYYAFTNTKHLKEVEIPSCSTTAALGYSFPIISDYAFYNSSIEKINIDGNSVMWIGNGAFEGSNLAEINLPDSVLRLGYDVFKNTPITNNEANYDSDGVLYLDNWLITTKNEPGPESYTVKEGTIVVSGGAFNWANLKELNIAKSVTVVGTNPAMNCPSLERYTVADGNRFISADDCGALYANNSSSFISEGFGIIAYPAAREETCYVINENAERICEMAFANTKYLKNVHIPSYVRETGIYPFGQNESSIYMLHFEGSESAWKSVEIAKSEISICRDIIDELHISFNDYVNERHTVTKDIVVEPSCTQDGGVKTTCSCGYELLSVTYEAKGHSYSDEWVTTKEPTCVSNGLKVNTCSVCGETETKYIRRLGHDNVVVSQTEGTCIQNSVTVYHCNRCGEDSTKYSKTPENHKTGEETITIEATCVSEGGIYYKCEYCNKAVGDPIEVYPATGKHTASDWITETKATCTKEGIEFIKCTTCDAKLEIRAIDIAPHTYMVTTLSSNCVEITKRYTCSVCNYSYDETTKTNKDHIYVKKTDAPTCTEEGRTYFKCKNCDEIEVISTTPATGHTGGEWVVTTQATCSKKGTETQYCTVCTAKVKTRSIPTTGHNMVRQLSKQHSCTYATYYVSCSTCSYFYMEDIMAFEDTVYGENEWGIGHIVEEVVVEPSCTEKGKTFRQCTVCGYIVGDVTETENFGHKWSDDAVTKEATCREEGVISKTCTLCGETEEKSIPKTAHTFGKWEYNSGNTFSGVCSVCGESFDSLEVELAFNQSEVTLYNKTSKVLSVTVTENISDEITFSSSDSSIVHVYSNGKITAKAPGHATITAKLKGTDITATCKVTVAPRNFGIEWICDGESFEYTFVEEGSTITPPEAPVKSGFVFVGWTPEIPEVMPSSSLTFTAVYNIVSQSPDYDVSATYSIDAFDEPVSLDVNQIEGEREPGGVYMVDGENYNQVGLYNIKAINEIEEVVQPNEGHTVRIRLALPEQYRNRTSFVIYHRFVDGTREQLSTAKGTLWVEDGYLVFDVSSFSEFEVLAISSSIKITKLPDKTTYNYNADGIDLTGIEITFKNLNGKTKKIDDPSHLTVTGFDSTKLGKQTVTVHYGQYTDTMQVNVRYSFWQIIVGILTFGLIRF